ncbi:hypothetical protein F511_22361 [Dorcoceras hygrometricum]|uniref:Uncharacterized protein n=1 Tax=Dorcoceras hygrometricum TaxID=472368 RepID=A0A2Z7CKE6_9LAMI|nr:hypothetical protein F511_22361 [Dorcoceras hygrometricum]
MLAVAFISTVDESINSRYSRSKKKKNPGSSCQPADDYSGIESAESFNQQLAFGVGDCKTMSHSAGRLCVVISADEATVDSVATQRYPDAIDEPDASNSSIQSKSLYESAVAKSTSRKLCIFSRLGSQAQRIEEGAKRSSRCVKSAAKQLTNYQSWMSTAELISNGESDSSLQKKRTQVLFLCRYFTEERCTKMERRQDSHMER